MKLAKASVWFGSVEKKGNIYIYLSLCPQIYIILRIYIIIMCFTYCITGCIRLCGA